MGTIKDRNSRDLVNTEEIKKCLKEYTNNCTKIKIIMNHITTMMWSVTQSQTFWNVNSSGP